MIKLLKYLLIGFGSVLLLLVAAILLLVVLVKPNDFKPEIEQAAQNAGMLIKLGGEISWHFYPWIGFNLNQISLFSHDSADPIVDIGKVSLSLGLRQLLAGKLKVKGIELIDASAALTRDQDGNGNWETIVAPTATQQDDQQSAGTNAEKNKEQKVQQTQKDQQSNKPVARADKQSALPPIVTGLELGFIHFNNVAVSFADHASELEAQLAIKSFAVEDFSFGSWFALRFDLSGTINQPSATAELQTFVEIYLAADLSEIRLRRFKLDNRTRTQILGDAEQMLDVQLASMLFDKKSKTIKASGLELELEASIPQLGEATQKITINSDAGFAFASKRLSLDKLQVVADLSVPQLGDARQRVELNTGLQLMLAGMHLSVPHLRLQAGLIYPQFLTQQIQVQGNLEGFAADLQRLVITNDTLKIDISEQLQLLLTSTSFNGSKGEINSGITIPAFHLKQAMKLIKVDGRQLVSLLPSSSDPKVLQKVALTGKVAARLDPLQADIKQLKLLLDDSTLQGKASFNSSNNNIAAGLKIDKVDLDRYLPEQPDKQDQAQAQQEQQEQQEQSSQEKKKEKSIGGADGKDASVSAQTIYSKQPLLPVELLRAYNLALDVQVDELIVKKKPFTFIQLNANSDGKKATAQIQARGFDGKTQVNAAITNLAATPKLGIAIALSSIDLQGVQQMVLEQPMVSGKGEVTAKLRTSGVAIYDWVHGLDGPLSVQMKNGKLLGYNISKIFCQAVSKVQGKKANFEAVGEDTQITSMQLALLFNQGKADIQTLNIAIPDLGVEAKGQINLPQLAFRVPLSIGITGNTLDSSCTLPVQVKLPLICEGQLFEDSPLSFCKPDHVALQAGLDDLLEAGKQQLQQELEKQQRAAAARLEAEKQAAQKALQKKLEKEKKAAQKQLEEKAKKELEKQLKKLF